MNKAQLEEAVELVEKHGLFRLDKNFNERLAALIAEVRATQPPQDERGQPVALSTLTDELAFKEWLLRDHGDVYNEADADRLWRFNHVSALAWKARAALAASAPAQQAGNGDADDAELRTGELNADYLKGFKDGQAVLTPPQPVAAEVDKQKIMLMVYDYARISDGIDSAEGDARRQQIAAMRERANEIRAALSGTGSDESGEGK